MFCTNLEITIHPTVSEPEIVPEKKPSQAKPWKWPRRILMLSVPKHLVPKYVTPPPEPFKTFGPVDPEIDFFSDHLCRPLIKTLRDNRRLFSFKGDSFFKKVDRRINRTWDSIYNYYRKQLRNKRLRRLQRIAERKKAKKPKKTPEQFEKDRDDHFAHLANPKPLHNPPPIVRKRQALEEIMAYMDYLANPKERPDIKPRELPTKVASAAKLYEITPETLALAQVLPRKMWRPSLPHMWVTPAALKAKATPRVEELAKPSLGRREAKKQDDDKYDPWFIPQTVLKYKATARILELAKPLERK